MIQDIVWAVSVVLMGCLAAVFAWVAVGAGNTVGNYGQVVASAYRLRAWLFLAAVLVLIGVNYRTLRQLPYVSSLALPVGVTAQPVEAVAQQWSWTVTPNAFVVGQTVDFQVTSKDVNHGFALFDPAMRIVAQTQAMPGYTNVLRYTFTKAGTYKVLCLEFCGVGHHVMTADITVAARTGSAMKIP